MNKKITAIAMCFLLSASSVGIFSSCAVSKYNVELVTDDKIGNSDDSSFILPAVDGLNYMIDSQDIKGTIKEASTEEEYRKAFHTDKENTPDLVITVGYKLYDNITAAAPLNPNIQYVAIDSAVDNKNSNLAGICYRVEESSFLVGYIAGMTTRTNKIGFVGGSESDTIYPFDYGFRAGIAYASKQRNYSEITVTSIYINSFNDRNLGKNAADKLYSDGCDIIFQAAGVAGLGVIDSAVNNGKYVIGVDVDQSYLAPKNVLTSAMKNIKNTVVYVIDQCKNYTGFAPGTTYMGLSDGGIGIPAENPNVNDAVLQRTMELRDLIIDGTIKPPATKEECDEYIKSLKTEKE